MLLLYYIIIYYYFTDPAELALLVEIIARLRQQIG